MFLKIVPLLSKKGFYARYYGGHELYESLDDKSGSPVHPTFLTTCLLFQVSMYCFKKIHQMKITSSLANKTRHPGKCIWVENRTKYKECHEGYYFNKLASTVYSGLNNIYSLSALGNTNNDKITQSNSFVWSVNTIFALLYIAYHFLSKKTEDDFTSVPPSLYLNGVMLTCMSLWPFMTNLALRQFTVKMIKNELNSLFWSSKQQKSKQKSLSILNVPIAKKNRRRVDFIEVRATSKDMPSERNLNTSITDRGRVDCVEMIVKSRPTMPDIQTWLWIFVV